ncbi:hypothetical protein QJS04_geneDACA013565 [Acorus gramineus]|uniref:Uncharacterized protein n=1 Tax=Acorus gramineus TaxID=55184 RepID=A0AAV9AGA7_ACOGR|nr:hypothetical protein QJS04_geneDACA013565 [Acorus gramineus]
MIKRWNSFNKVCSPTTTTDYVVVDHSSSSSLPVNAAAADLRTVYVGKSRRRYLLSSRLVDHPLFRVLVERSGGGDDGGGGDTVVGCEVVLFEHLLWMLENGDPQPESLDELVEYYAC